MVKSTKPGLYTTVVLRIRSSTTFLKKQVIWLNNVLIFSLFIRTHPGLSHVGASQKNTPFTTQYRHPKAYSSYTATKANFKQRGEKTGSRSASTHHFCVFYSKSDKVQVWVRNDEPSIGFCLCCCGGGVIHPPVCWGHHCRKSDRDKSKVALAYYSVANCVGATFKHGGEKFLHKHNSNNIF